MGNHLNSIQIPQVFDCETINKYIRHTETSEVSPAEIAHPLMAQIIYCYVFRDYTQDNRYEEESGNLLEQLFDSVSDDMPMRLQNGLLGISCGLTYLLRNHFVSGNEDTVLADFDQIFFAASMKISDASSIDWYGWLYYCRLRLSLKRLPPQSYYEYTWKEHTISLLDRLKNEITEGMKWDKNIIFEINELHQIKLCPVSTASLLSLFHSIECNKITFVIPLRIDSPERERNLDLLLTILTRFENTDILLLEGDKEQRYRTKKKYGNVHYHFVTDPDPVFHRTKYLNWLLKKASGPIVGIWDTDILISKEQILEAEKAILTGKACMSFPYDGRFYFLSPEETDTIIQNRLYENLPLKIKEGSFFLNPFSTGGAFFVNKKVYIESGGENENIYGWGPDDKERVKRMEIWGLPIYRANGPLYHLFHPRKNNSRYADRDIEINNKKEFLKICQMSKAELENYIRTWCTQEGGNIIPVNYSKFRKHKMESAFWKEEISRYQLWYEGKLSCLYNTPAPAPAEKVVLENPLHSWILTWLNMHQKPKYLLELNVDALQFIGKKVLDVGAGPIPSATCFYGSDLYLLDPLMSMYKELGFPHQLYPEINFIEASAEKIPIEDDFFDAIISVNALDHLDNLELVAKELKRVAKENCTFIMHVNYHTPTICEPIEINDTIIHDLFGWIPGLRKVSQSRRAYCSISDEEDEYVLWSNLK